VAVDLSLLGAVVVSQLIDFFGLLCCCSLLRSTKYVLIVLLFFTLCSLHDSVFLAFTASSRISEGLDGSYGIGAEDVEAGGLAGTQRTGKDALTLDSSKELWQDRCRTGCRCLQLTTCNLFGGHHIGEDLEAVGEIFAQFFHHDGFLDVVPSDVVAGLVLVRLQQRAKVASLRSIASGDSDLEEDSARVETALVMKKVKNTYYHTDPQLAKKKLFKKSDLGDYNLVTDAAHYSYYALAAYTHLMYMVMYPATALCRLCHFRCCQGGGSDVRAYKRTDDVSELRSTQAGPGSGNKSLRAPPTASTMPLGAVPADSCVSCGSLKCCPLGPGYVIGDKSCNIHKTAMLKMTSKRKGELVFANFSNDMNLKPYGIFVDHERETVVVTIRGTLSLEDCITDALADPVSMKEAGQKWGFNGEGKFAHSGMLRSAMWIRQDIESSGLVAELIAASAAEEASLQSSDVEPAEVINRKPSSVERSSSSQFKNSTLKTPLTKTVCRQLIIVGHSLGAGTAVLLSMLMKPAYPTVQCFAYGSPGSVLDEATSREVAPYITSVVLGKDLVGSLSVKNLSHLREQVLDAIARCKVNKMTVLRALFEDKTAEVDKFLHPPGTKVGSEFERMVDTYLEHMNRRSLETKKVRLHISGRIIHLVKTRTVRDCCSSKQRSWQAVDADLTDFMEIKISPTMGWEHFPDQYAEEMDSFVEHWQ
jgi:sn1-specific diacylglycerol lipase